LGSGRVPAYVFTALLITLFGVCLSAQHYSVQLTERGVTVRATGASVRDLLETIARETGIQVSGAIDERDTISIAVDDEPLAETLARILANIDYVIVGSPPIRVWARSQRFMPHEDRAPPVSAPPDPAPPADSDSLTDPRQEDDAPTAASDSPLAEDPELQLLERAHFFDKAAPSALLDATQSSNAAVRERAHRALAESNSAAIPGTLLTDAAADTDPHVSATATRLLDERNAGDAVEQIGTLLHHRDPVMRFTAIELLRRRGDAAALAELRRALDDADETIRTTAQDAVSALEGHLERRNMPRHK
jgi:hypothetical protein